MRNVTMASVVCLALSSMLFASCGGDSDSGGSKGGTDGGGVGGSGGTLAGGAGGTGGGKGGTGGKGGSGGTGGAPKGTCQGACGAEDPDTKCKCGGTCEKDGDCCPDFKTVCTAVTMPAGCVNASAGFFAACNPVTNEGCTGSGVACDLSGGGSTCYPNGNVKATGEVCTPDNNEYCQPTNYCYGGGQGKTGICKKFCCGSSDCGGAACTPIQTDLGALGTCEPTTDGGSDAADGATDGGSDAADDATDGGGGTGGATDGGGDAAGDATDSGGSDAAGDAAGDATGD